MKNKKTSGFLLGSIPVLSKPLFILEPGNSPSQILNCNLSLFRRLWLKILRLFVDSIECRWILFALPFASLSRLAAEKTSNPAFRERGGNFLKLSLGEELPATCCGRGKFSC